MRSHRNINPHHPRRNISHKRKGTRHHKRKGTRHHKRKGTRHRRHKHRKNRTKRDEAGAGFAYGFGGGRSIFLLIREPAPARRTLWGRRWDEDDVQLYDRDDVVGIGFTKKWGGFRSLKMMQVASDGRVGDVLRRRDPRTREVAREGIGDLSQPGRIPSSWVARDVRERDPLRLLILNLFLKENADEEEKTLWRRILFGGVQGEDLPIPRWNVDPTTSSYYYPTILVELTKAVERFSESPLSDPHSQPTEEIINIVNVVANRRMEEEVDDDEEPVNFPVAESPPLPSPRDSVPASTFAVVAAASSPVSPGSSSDDESDEG
jgi:hypothetical protein